MGYWLIVEDETPDQTQIEVRTREFLQGRGQGSVFARNAARALERVGLSGALAGRQRIPDAYNELDGEIRVALENTPIPADLDGICCDLKMSADGSAPPMPTSGANLVKLFYHWRSVQGGDFQLIVLTANGEWEPRVHGFYDEFAVKPWREDLGALFGPG
jgi:hypothetical protein